MDYQLNELKDVDRSLFPGSFTIRALRDSRYHNTAYAIAELIDNSVEAHAEQIELLCMEEPQLVKERQRRRVSAIAVLDNGTGMDRRTLLDALKFGGGTRHDSGRGIGKYGMGLPTSSMSQCKRVDVWTWQDGPWFSMALEHWTQTLLSRVNTLFLFQTESHKYLTYGRVRAAMKSLKTAQAHSSYGANWIKFSGKPAIQL